MTKAIKVLIVDDEEYARKQNKSLCENYFNTSKYIYEANNIELAKTIILEESIDILLLDIDLGSHTGFDLINELTDIQFQIIFITGFNDMAIRAFRANALDYILKPIDSNIFYQALEKAVSNISQKNIQLRLNNLLQYNKDTYPQKIVLNTSEDYIILNVTDIIRLQADVNYTNIYSNSGENFIISQPLKEYQNILDPQQFIRVHQSHLINIDYIERYRKRDGGFIILKNKDQVPVSQRKRENLLLKLKQL